MEESKEELLTCDPEILRYRQGYAQALRDILDTTLEELS